MELHCWQFLSPISLGSEKVTKLFTLQLLQCWWAAFVHSDGHILPIVEPETLQLSWDSSLPSIKILSFFHLVRQTKRRQKNARTSNHFVCLMKRPTFVHFFVSKSNFVSWVCIVKFSLWIIEMGHEEHKRETCGLVLPKIQKWSIRVSPLQPNPRVFKFSSDSLKYTSSHHHHVTVWHIFKGFFVVVVLSGYLTWCGVWMSFGKPPRDPLPRICDISASHRGEDIFDAAARGDVGAVRHFLREDPDSVNKGDECEFGRSLGG